MDVPNLDDFVTGAAATDNESVLMAAPSNPLDGSLMAETPDFYALVQVPDE
jgi:hypothetical protein